MTSICHATISSTCRIAATSASRSSRSRASTCAQQFVGLDNPEYQQARSTAFSPDPEQKFLYVAGSPVIYILNRKTLEIVGEFRTGAAQANPPGHQIATDQRGNIYAPQAAQTGPDGKGGGAGVQKFAFKGLSRSRNFKALRKVVAIR